VVGAQTPQTMILISNNRREEGGISAGGQTPKAQSVLRKKALSLNGPDEALNDSFWGVEPGNPHKYAHARLARIML